MKANASKHKAMSWKQMLETEKRLRREAREILAAAEQADAEDDARWGDKRGDELPKELARRQSRLARIGEAKKALTARAQERAAEAGEPAEEARKAKPRDKDQYNFTDPESRIMKAGGGFEQAYNAQAAVEPVGQLIVGQTLTNEANDKRQMQPLVETGGADAAEVANEGGQEDLRAAQGDCRAGVRTDQTSARHQAVSITGTGEGAGRMGADLHDAQHLEAAPAGDGLKRG